ncbi:hypothetical protein [Streptomyces sp. A012304]|uniref:hypothetical protein n=1 Tax=Streptomyces sp. A012304 TaxID=375446 RepID=UPI00222EFD7C|nr:hypothetical protein [Streptomyces sp. A012304]GKQ34586.1 hypothetical protein ALMP_11350 [Streptomyces sp. A012304]
MTRANMVGALASAAGWAVRWLPGATGAALISWAALMVYVPAGLAVAGLFCLAADWRAAR